MKSGLFTASALLAAGLSISACGKQASSPGATRKPMSATGIVTAKQLAAIQLVPPPGAPTNGKWTPCNGGTQDGKRCESYNVGDDFYMDFTAWDCNLPEAKEAAKKPEGTRGDSEACYYKASGNIGGYAVYRQFDGERTIRVGHVLLRVGYAFAKFSVTNEEALEAWLLRVAPTLGG